MVTNALRSSVEGLLSLGSLVAMGISVLLIVNAAFMGRKFDEYTASGHVVGGEEEGDNSAQKKELDTQMVPLKQGDLEKGDAAAPGK